MCTPKRYIPFINSYRLYIYIDLIRFKRADAIRLALLISKVIRIAAKKINQQTQYHSASHDGEDKACNLLQLSMQHFAFVYYNKERLYICSHHLICLYHISIVSQGTGFESGRYSICIEYFLMICLNNYKNKQLGKNTNSILIRKGVSEI